MPWVLGMSLTKVFPRQPESHSWLSGPKMCFAHQGPSQLGISFCDVSCSTFLLSPSFSGAGSLPESSSICLLTLQGLPSPTMLTGQAVKDSSLSSLSSGGRLQALCQEGFGSWLRISSALLPGSEVAATSSHWWGYRGHRE